MTYTNRNWVLASYPEGMPEANNWHLEQSEIGTPGDGQILARALYLSVDPYMRGRISAKKGYAKGVEIGEVMIGAAVAEVVESKHPQWNSGDLIETFNFGWQEYSILDPETVTRVDPNIGPPHAWLSYIGMPGITAWCALKNVGKPVEGNTVLVSAASGAVGAGCRATGESRRVSRGSGCQYRFQNSTGAETSGMMPV